jgi:DNA-binding beta-propeller fold protein YncE
VRGPFKRLALLVITPLLLFAASSCTVIPLFNVDIITAEFDSSGSFAGISVTFSATLDNADLYEWDFGDGSSGLGQIVIHLYAVEGTYQITVRVSKDGDTFAFDKSIVIASNTAPPVPFSKLYWIDPGSGKVQRANTDGSNIQDLVTGVGNSALHIAVDADAGHIYWTDQAGDRIRRSSLTGASVIDFITGLISPTGVALDTDFGKIYWADNGADVIRRANLDSSNNELIISGLDIPGGIALDLVNEHIYWTDTQVDQILRSDLNGSNVKIILDNTQINQPHGIALDVPNGKIYFVHDPGSGGIRRVNFNGTDLKDLVTGLSDPRGIALDLADGKIYWTDIGTSKIQRSNLDGSNDEDLITGLNEPFSIVLSTK